MNMALARRLALRLARHAARVLSGTRAPWADAMRRELDYIEDDAAALRWALGCILASYRTRLADRPRFDARAVWRHAAASGVLLLLIGAALQDRAGGQTEPPAAAEMACGVAGAAPQAQARAPDTSCGDGVVPRPFSDTIRLGSR